MIKEIKQNKIKNKQEIGFILKIYDGIVTVKGLNGIKFNEMVKFENNIHGVVFGILKNYIEIIILGEEYNINVGEKVIRKYEFFKTNVGNHLLGRVINVLGEPLDGYKLIKSKIYKNIHPNIPSIIERESIRKPLHTGIKIIDSLIPIGRGQRELIVGDRKTGKTTIAIDTIINQRYITQKEEKVYCIYTSIGQKKSSVAKIIKKLIDTQAIKYTIVIVASSSDPVSLQYYAPYVASTIAEYFRDNSMNSLIVYDDLSKHAIAYRQISLLLKKSPGREAYPGDIFYIHSKLLERSAKLSKAKGGGSLTAMPIIETQEGDVSSYITTNIISITDGQIFLEPELFKKGIKPAINIGLSVSRIGSSAQTSIMKTISSTMKLRLALFREMESFAKFSTELDKNTQELIDYGKQITNMLKQEAYNPLSLEEQVIHIFGVTQKLIDNSTKENMNTLLNKIYLKIKKTNIKLINEIKYEKKMNNTVKINLINEFKKYYKKK